MAAGGEEVVFGLGVCVNVCAWNDVLACTTDVAMQAHPV